MTRGCLAGFGLMLAACGGSERVPAWSLLDDAPASWMAVAGTSARDVWVVGGRTSIAGEPQVARYDGERWSDVPVGTTGLDLWWVFGVPGSDRTYLGGSKGTILLHRGSTFEEMPTPGGAAIVFGIWGSSDTDLWAVGSENGAGFVWRGDGTRWTAQPLPAGVTGRLFKVHGRAANDVWIVGGAGVTLHWGGSALELVTAPTPWSLFSVVTTPDRVVAAGGTAGEGTILEYTGGAWTVAAPSGATAWRGVAAADGAIVVVGESGTVARHDGTGWSMASANVQRNFHAAWIDPDGGVWGVGGDFDRLPLTSNGFITYHGTEPPRSRP